MTAKDPAMTDDRKVLLGLKKIDAPQAVMPGRTSAS
jgi:hypothetical protein